jgi:hypothetical protein
MDYRDVPEVMGYQLDPDMPLHHLAAHRINLGRDLKIIVTAEDSETGVGKTTLSGSLAIPWTKMFAGMDWYVEPDEWGEGLGTVNPKEYFSIVRRVGNDYPKGCVVIVDDAEELDARRSMQNLNVKFSQRWMLMRLKQVITIITLPSPSSIDSRLEELADVWINVQRRGKAMVHDIRVQSYGGRNVMTKKVHTMEWPDISDHPQMKRLESLKERKMDDWDTEQEEEDEEVDPDEVRKETLAQTAQEMRDNGYTAPEIAEHLPYGEGWVYKHTNSSDDVAADD